MPKGRTRRCAFCGEKMLPTRIVLCETCQQLGFGARMRPNGLDPVEMLQVAKERQKEGYSPIMDMGLSDISALAKCYKSPYNTYGRLRGYVEATHKLPPTEFERSRDEAI